MADVSDASPIVYLASPYSKGNSQTRLARFNAVTHVAAKMIKDGSIVFSPITMTHPIDLILSTENSVLDSNFWVRFDENFMRHCGIFRILTLPGWEISRGVQRETEYFLSNGIRPEFLSPAEYGVEASNPLFMQAFAEDPS